MNSFIVVRVYYWTTVEWKELLPDSSLSHLDYESRIYDIGLCGTSMSGICYIIAEQYWEAWGLFWKRSVSLCFLGVLFGFGCWVVCVVVCCLVFCVCWWHLDHCLTFSLLRGKCQSKQDVLMTVWASSAHGTGKKKTLSHTSALTIFRSSKIHKSLTPWYENSSTASLRATRGRGLFYCSSSSFHYFGATLDFEL